MDVDSYIGLRQAEWRRLEELSSGGRRRWGSRSGADILELVRLYLRASSHLAEVQTRYHDPQLEAYLNAIVARAHAVVYSSRPQSFRGLLRVFGSRYRAAIHRTTPHILVIAALLVGLVVATDVWVSTSGRVQAALLPPEVREAIREAGGRGGLGIDPAVLSNLIFQNNVQVAFLAFAAGITLGIGTVWVVVQNAVFIGMIAGAFHVVGRDWAFWSLVLPHGFLEILAICIAGGAGLRMGWGVIDPGDRSRGEALAAEARDAVMVVVGVIPAFGVAAIIEGFLSGTTGLPVMEVLLGAAVALGYLAFLVGPPRRRAPTGAPAP